MIHRERKGKKEDLKRYALRGVKLVLPTRSKPLSHTNHSKRKIKAKKGEENDDRTMVSLETPKALT